jgi:hypothetical protein
MKKLLLPLSIILLIVVGYFLSVPLSSFIQKNKGTIVTPKKQITPIAKKTITPEQMGKKNTLTRTEWNKKISWPTTCNEDYKSWMTTFSEDGYQGVDVFPLDQNKSVIYVFCGMFTYQGYGYLYLSDGITITPIDLGLTDAKGEHTPKVTGIVTFDEIKKELSIFYKARAAGDCGEYRIYVYNDNTFNLKEERTNDCNAKSAGMTIDQWPIVFQDKSLQ